MPEAVSPRSSSSASRQMSESTRACTRRRVLESLTNSFRCRCFLSFSRRHFSASTRLPGGVGVKGRSTCSRARLATAANRLASASRPAAILRRAPSPLVLALPAARSALAVALA
eukprot:CAMPEP_0172587260 /NCGR_PEP_ID=MMETSP1068-20121228/6338_1 /TAXON_ID=35684 /ORGANISM="Pseudopedinella elastica, Strain CCMP716" /LENGTH=113 /DNA_ID=CAMNT_0013382219 /DNA_START=416 /DNA_END=754 /DNA_ORIENTATION=+